MMSGQKLIYVVDDDPFINMLVVKRFTSENYKVDSFVNGEDCLKALNRNPDLIILDYFFDTNGKDVMNGMEIFDKIKVSKPKTHVIMLSGQEKGEVVLELARKGIDDYIIKDNNLIENLQVAISDLLDR